MSKICLFREEKATSVQNTCNDVERRGYLELSAPCPGNDLRLESAMCLHIQNYYLLIQKHFKMVTVTVIWGNQFK